MDGDNQLTIAFRTPRSSTDKVIFKVKGTAEIDLAGEADDVAIQSQDVVCYYLLGIARRHPGLFPLRVLLATFGFQLYLN